MALFIINFSLSQFSAPLLALIQKRRKNGFEDEKGKTPNGKNTGLLEKKKLSKGKINVSQHIWCGTETVFLTPSLSNVQFVGLCV